MKLKLSENIQAMRRARRLTQEQLAEAMGVSVGAVSKWENGLSNPDVALIPEIAEFFDTSVDVLLGYGWEKRGMGECAARIEALANARRDEEACREAAKGIQRYPGSFRVVYACAKVYQNVGFARGDGAMLRKARELLERSLDLIEQNEDDSVSELSIQCDIGACWVFMGEYERALEHLRRHNERSINNRLIGFCLCRLGRFDEAMETCSEAFGKSLADLFNTAIDVINCMGQTGRNDEALEMIDWLLGIGRGLEIEGRTSFVKKLTLLLTCAKGVISADIGREDDAERYCREAVRGALRYDRHAEAGSLQAIRFYHGREHSVYDDIGEHAMDALRGLIAEQKNEALTERFERIVKEATRDAREE